MTAKELSEILSGREYGMEITKNEERQAADNGLPLYGYSDDDVVVNHILQECESDPVDVGGGGKSV